MKHVVSTRSYGHGIGAGDVNGDKRNDILTPQGWLEAPRRSARGGQVDVSRDRLAAAADSRAGAGRAPSLTTPPAVAAPPAGRPPPPATAAAARGAEWGFLYVLDINGDGRNDVLTPARTATGSAGSSSARTAAWQQHVIDHSWSHSHASVLADINGDGRPDLVTGKRFQARNVPAPGDDDPLGIYWYEFTPARTAVTWTRHTIDYGSKAGGGLQMAVRDIDGDGDMDVVSAGKSGLFLAENVTPRPGRH